MDWQAADSFMAVGAHCDDVDLRCGGTFARLVREGRRGCYVVAVENAYVGAHFAVADSREALAVRRQESTRAAAEFGASRLEWLQLKSNHLDKLEAGPRVYPSFDSLEAMQEELKDCILEGLPPVANAVDFPRCVRRLADLIADVRPQVVFTHSPDDRHPDHYGLSRFVDFVVRRVNGEGRDVALYFWEPGSGGPLVDFAPDLFVELSDGDVAAKQRGIDCYASQFAPGVVADFASERARAYGRLAGLDWAEGFRRCGCYDAAEAWNGQCSYLRELAAGRAAPEVLRLRPADAAP